MNRRSFLDISARAGAASAFLDRGAFAASQAVRRPNVIVVLTDDQGYGDVSSHGNPVLKTPNLDRLRQDSIRLTDFHVASMCTPTRSQLMSGRDALVNCACNVSSGRTMMRADLPTMADLFAGSGYRTGIFGKWHLGDAYPYRPEDRGFEETVWFPSSHIGSSPDYWNNDYYNDTYKHNGKRQPYQGYCTDVFFDEAMKWMRARAASKEPFFSYIPTNTPHGPLFVPERYSGAYSGQPAANFFGMVANIDENMGRLEKMLEETGLKDNTIVVFMTDNGGTGGVNVYNAGMRGRKITLWDGGHRVPCFIRWPQGGLKGGRDINELTEVQDMLPTLIDLCALKRPQGMDLDGMSLAGLLRGNAKALPERMLVAQFGRMNVGRPQYGDSTVMWNKWRLVSQRELYDISTDPGQKNNVIAKNPGVAAKLRAHYEKWWKEVDPRLDSYLPSSIGSSKDNPVLLSPTEWADVFFDQGTQVRAGVRKNGIWHIDVEQDGMYEFTLRRWPREVNAGMREGVPAHKGECGQYAAGVALPVATAGLRAAARYQSQDVGPADREVVFTSQMSEGRNTLQSWFYDEAGKEICGAYYVYVERKTQRG